MATGPEHYALAQQDLERVSNLYADDPFIPILLAQAQVHATLALAAAVGTLDAYAAGVAGAATGRTAEDADEWRKAVQP